MERRDLDHEPAGSDFARQAENADAEAVELASCTETERTAPAESFETYADRLRRGEHMTRAARGRYSRRELQEMERQARALISLATSGWLPDRDDAEQGRLFREEQRLV